MRVLPSYLLLPAVTGARRLRHGLALLACLGVLGWTLLYATHWHEPESAGSGQHPAAECLLCLATPAGATPPAHALLQLLPPPAALVACAPAPRVHGNFRPSSYQSRAPPAG